LVHNYSKAALGWTAIYVMFFRPRNESRDDQNAANENRRWISHCKIISEKCK